jgi:hypothetical protein
LSTEYDREKDYYEVLGVDQAAGADEIRRSYRKLAKKYHPDANPGDPGGERFKEISEARDVLLDDQRRRRYDKARSSPGTPRTVFPMGGPGARTPPPSDPWAGWIPTPPPPPPPGSRARTPGPSDPWAGWIPTSPPPPPPGSRARTPGPSDPRPGWIPTPPPPPPPGPDDRARGKMDRRARLRLIALSITTVIVLVVVVLSLTVFSSTPGPAATDEAAVAKAEAATVNSVVDSSASSQAEFLNAINNVSKCTDLAGSVSQIGQVLGQRTSELSEASGLATWALPNGVPLRSYLVETIRIFQHSNEIFLSWAEEVSAHGCTPPNLHSSAYNQGATLFQDAEVAENNFIAFWNLVASKNGFPPRSKVSF